MLDDDAAELGEFFDSLSMEYTETIERCFPRYREMLWSVLEYLPRELKVDRILELGSGTGNLSVLAHRLFPDASITLVDVSRDSLEVCRTRFTNSDVVEFVADDFRNLSFQNGTYDLVISSIAIHHVESLEKRKLFRSIFDWLRPQGVLAFADQCAGETVELTCCHSENWKALSTRAGSTEDEWAMWMQHQRDCDHHDTLANHLQWLRAAGFQHADCTWRYLLWSSIQAQKPG